MNGKQKNIAILQQNVVCKKKKDTWMHIEN